MKLNKYFIRIKKYIHKHFDSILILLFIFFLAIIYAYISVVSHNHFQTFGWDLGFFDQIIWKVSQGDLAAYSTIAKENLLADHFQVVLYFLAPLYLIRSDVRMILVAQAFLVTFASVPLYLLAKDVSKNVIFSLSVIISYLLFIGTQWTILNEFHQAAFIPLFLVLVFYALHFHKKTLFWVGIVGLIITKEEYGLLVTSLGVFIWVKYRNKILGLITFLLGLFSFFGYIYLLVPLISLGGKYIHFDFGPAGYTPIDVINKSISNPMFFLNSMISPGIKLKTVFDSFLNWGFLPVFSPYYLIPVLEHFISRFIYAGPQFTKWANVNHHAAPLGILLSIASISSSYFIVNYLLKRGKQRSLSNLYGYLGVIVIIFSLFQNIYLHGPINSIIKPQLYQTQSWMADNNNILNKVPKDAVVAAQNSMVPHLSQRNKIYLLPEIADSEYIVVDMHDGPNKYSPLNYDQMKQLIDDLLQKKEFIIQDKIGEATLLSRRNISQD